MERCAHYTQLLSARMDGELTEDQARELDAHLALCPDCRALAEELEAIHAAFSQFEEVPAPEGFARGVMDRVRAEERPKVVPLFRRPWFRSVAGLAACALLCVGLYSAGGDRGVEDVQFTMDVATASEPAEAREETAISADLEARPKEWNGQNEFQQKTITLFDAKSSLDDAAAAPSHYWFANDQYLRVTWQEDLEAPSARILGSADSLAEFLARFPDDLSGVTDRYGAEYFQTGRLLALLITEPSGSIRHALAFQGLLWDRVTVQRTQPEELTDDMAAWLILAEVDMTFEEGHTLDVILEEG